MIDVRKACKIFLDFVYENKLIPEKIVEILNQSQENGETSTYDIRKILQIMAYNFRYTRTNDDLDQQIVAYKDDFKSIGEEPLRWFRGHQGNLKDLSKQCNDFFHNVADSKFEKSFIQELINLVQSAEFLSYEKRQGYISQMKNLLEDGRTGNRLTHTGPRKHNPDQNPDQKQAFRKYLENEHYSLSTIDSYIRGVDRVGKLTNIERNLWEIRDAEKMRELVLCWEKNTNHLYEEYKEQDLRTHKTLSNAVKRYAEFIASVKDILKI